MKTFPKLLSILVLLFIILLGMLAEPVRADASSADRSGSNSGMVLQPVRIVDLRSAITTPPPTPKTPSGSITVTKPKYTWTKVAGATNYLFQIWKGTKLISSVPSSASDCGASICSNTPNIILTYAAYSWRVAAKVGENWTDMSAYKSFEVVKPALPPTPITPSGTITVTKPKYTWTKVAGATNYQFKIRKGTTIIYTSPVLAASVCGATTCSNTPNKVLTYAAHSWMVGAKVGGKWIWSAYKNFTVIKAISESVLVDNAHANYMSINNDYSIWKQLINVNGYKISETTSAITAAKLSGIKVFVALMPKNKFTTAEKNTLLTWVKNGGSLLIIEDQYPWYHEAANDLSTLFGIETSPVVAAIDNTKCDIRNYEICLYPRNYTTYGSIMSGIGTTEIFASGSLTSSIASTVIRLDTDAIPSQANIVMARVLGKGRVLVSGDANFWTNPLLDQEFITAYENKKLALQVINWLATGKSTGSSAFVDVIVDGSLEINPANLENNPGMIGE